MFRKILIANRGEIAVRVIRACREMGISPVAVYSEADRKALHVRRADEAYAIGPAPAAESYLRIDRILAVAKKAGAEALHPGYGFLAEHPALERACAEAGIVFIGPSADSLELMGSKTRARQAAARAGVPVVPGTDHAVPSAEAAAALAAEYGYPVVVKASAGGGGKGMRLVRSPAEMASAFRDARSEAQNAFGDDELYLEKHLERPRHIEVQIFGDRHGSVVHLGERECSIQRRHQKVVEECPSPLVDAGLRDRMGEAAVRVARAAGYYNAGTVEFLVDARRNFYFLEMNTRLQVEHPVTEMVTGLDLVKLQFAVASGEALPFRQEEVRWRGAAIECRIYAEDPDNHFFPSPGTVMALEEPGGPGVRIDGGVYRGWTVPLEYDPLIAKLVCWGGSRGEAVERLRRALQEYSIEGIETTIPFFKKLVAQPEFLAGELDTGLIDRMLETEKTVERLPAKRREDLAAVTAALFFAQRNGRGGEGARHPGAPGAPASGAAGWNQSPWKIEGRRRLLRPGPKTDTR